MEVCFIDKDYREFLREQVPDLDRRVGEGKFVDVQGRVIGTHCGFPYFTVGQRKGLGIALGKPAYVLRLNARKNTVMLGDERPVSGRRRRREFVVGAFQGEGFGCDTRPVGRVLRR